MSSQVLGNAEEDFAKRVRLEKESLLPAGEEL